MRSDAAHNRELLLAAADHAFQERGIDVPVADIAQAAGVGRATLFRNFPTKEDLIVAIVIQRMEEALEDGRALLESVEDDAEVAFTFIEDMVGRQMSNRALLEVVNEHFLLRPEIEAAHSQLVELIERMLERGKRAGAVRPEIGAMDVIVLMKGICMAPETMPQALSTEVLMRYLDLVRAAITTPEHSRPLRGTAQTLEQLHEQIHAHAEVCAAQLRADQALRTSAELGPGHRVGARGGRSVR
jgi:AcrR family transcriptional regulator